MSLAIFGLCLLAATVGLAWKNGRATAVAVVAIMLGLTIAASGGVLSEASRALVDSVRSALDSIGTVLFGG